MTIAATSTDAPVGGGPQSGELTAWLAGHSDTVSRVLSRANEHSPDKVFLDFAGDKYTYSQVWRLALRRAAGLVELGVGHGETVVCILDNNVDAVISWFAANFVGAVWVPVNTALKGEYLRHQVGDAAAAVVLAESDYAQRILDIVHELPELKHLIVRGEVPASSAVSVTSLDAVTPQNGLPAPADVAPGDLAMLIYTSGTTGPSKGCMISQNYICNVARNTAAIRNPDFTLWTPLPLFHLNAAGTSVLATAVNRATVSIAERFSLSGFWPEIKRSSAQQVSILGIMITLIATMSDTPEMAECFGQIEHVGGAPWTPELIATWEKRFGVRSAGNSVFGLTEASFITSNLQGLTAPLGASGRRNDDFDVRIVDDHDVEVPDGEPGEVMVRPRKPHVMFEGYWRRPEATMAVMGNLWFHTGDIGRFDSAGWFWFVDRKKDYLRRRGENISSYELERTFRSHSDIADVAVHAVPSRLTEDDVKVTAVRCDGADLTEEQLCRWCLDKLPYFAVPRYIEFRTELPRNATGKVLKHQLRDEGVTPATWDIERSDIQVVKR
ncbi:MAG: carnitine-CoA ligase [Mycobacterium sp.]|nr:carnitine-CoA ligase [Mycobacterium sp.]MDT5167288.1 carnitine-CoA ligase [Mycobacterium sp.]MDT5200669.1 carnitine-CoA ligase [Mycobacterium sp.]MDT5254290.1 carnitine-CoA ligase [Mycobacterium sp.]MDT5276875.1 carnitine-CoA ligase [Mycobacterium sp.]